MKIYVGNLSYNVSEDELSVAFKPFGRVDTAKIIKDKNSGQSKGFGFVEMPSAKEARSAINDLNGKELKGRILKVNEARSGAEKGKSKRGSRDRNLF